jgi:hypothetical protein
MTALSPSAGPGKPAFSRGLPGGIGTAKLTGRRGFCARARHCRGGASVSRVRVSRWHVSRGLEHSRSSHDLPPAPETSPGWPRWSAEKLSHLEAARGKICRMLAKLLVRLSDDSFPRFLSEVVTVRRGLIYRLRLRADCLASTHLCVSGQAR